MSKEPEPEGEPRRRQINIQVNEAEYQAIQLAAELVEVSVTELVRRIITGICDPNALQARHSRPALIVMDARLNRLDIANKLNRVEPTRRFGTGAQP